VGNWLQKKIISNVVLFYDTKLQIPACVQRRLALLRAGRAAAAWRAVGRTKVASLPCPPGLLTQFYNKCR